MLQANKNLSAFGHMLCAFVNWKVVRDTMLHRGLERLFSILPYQEDMSAASIEVAANILQAVEPWMEMNWGYTSWRYLDNYYHRMQQWCQRQIKTPAGRFVDVEFPYDILVSPFCGHCVKIQPGPSSRDSDLLAFNTHSSCMLQAAVSATLHN